MNDIKLQAMINAIKSGKLDIKQIPEKHREKVQEALSPQ